MPVLLRQYLKLNAKVIAFNVDPDFGNVVDALIYMDLRTMPPRLQEFYFTREGAAVAPVRWIICWEKTASATVPAFCRGSRRIISIC